MSFLGKLTVVAGLIFVVNVTGFIGSPLCVRRSLSPTATRARRTSSVVVEEPVVDEPIIQSREVRYEGDSQVRVVPAAESTSRCYGSDMSTAQAQAIAMEGALKRTVPKATLLDALHCLAHSTEVRGSLAGVKGPVPADAMDGVWRLRFCNGAALEGFQVDGHGYMDSRNHMELHVDSEVGKVSLNKGKTKLRGDLIHSEGAKVISATLHEVAVGPMVLRGDAAFISFSRLPLHLNACLVEKNTLAFHCVFKTTEGFILFDRRKGVLPSVAPSSESLLPSSPRSPRPQPQSPLMPKVTMPSLRELQESHERSRTAVEDKGQDYGSFGAFMRYLEKEGIYVYGVLAGPALLRYLKFHAPFAAVQLGNAVSIINEAIHQYFQQVST